MKVLQCISFKTSSGSPTAILWLTSHTAATLLRYSFIIYSFIIYSIHVWNKSDDNISQAGIRSSDSLESKYTIQINVARREKEINLINSHLRLQSSRRRSI